MKSVFITLLCLISLPGLAKERRKYNLAPPLDLEKKGDTVTVKESFIDINHRTFRRIEYKGEVFYLKLQQPVGDDSTRLEPRKTGLTWQDECVKGTINDADSARLVGEAKITEIASLYVESLHSKCESYTPSLADSFFGIKIKTSKNTDVRIGLESILLGIPGAIFRGTF